jgi:hypothetical protein
MTDFFTTMTLRRERGLQTVLLVVYVFLLSVITDGHELWGDELHSWNIAKGSNTFTDLISNTRYEGHPPVWYTLMWLLSKCTHHLAYLQYLQFVIIGTVGYLLLFCSPLPAQVKSLLPFGYYFLYEYAAFSRNYAIGLLLAFSICILLARKNEKDTFLYYLLLFLLSNTHLLGALLAASLHLYFILNKEHAKAKTLLHFFIGGVVLLPSLYFIFPPSDSELSMSFWMSHWNKEHLSYISAAPAKAFFPMPDWHLHHFWNTNILAGNTSVLTTGLISIVCCALAVYILRGSKKALTIFLANLFLTCILAFIFPLTSARYVGFIFIGFVIACWLYNTEKPFSKKEINLLRFLLVLQICGSLVAVPRDMEQHFSNAYKVNEILKQVRPDEKTVTDYWCLNNVAAFADKPFYCIELKKEVSFLKWDQAFAKIIAMPDIYTVSFNDFFRKTGAGHVQLLSSNSPAAINKRDTSFAEHYIFVLEDSCTGAIESHSDLYLYNVRPSDANIRY